MNIEYILFADDRTIEIIDIENNMKDFQIELLKLPPPDGFTEIKYGRFLEVYCMCKMKKKIN